MFQTNPVGEGLFSCVQNFFCCHKIAQVLAKWLNTLYGYTTISRKFVGKNVHTTIPKGKRWDMINTRCSWHCSCRTYFCCFLLASANIRPWPLASFFQTFWRTVNSKPLTTPFNFGIVACTFSDNLSRNSCIFMAHFQLTLLFAIFKHAGKGKGGGGRGNHVLLLF